MKKVLFGILMVVMLVSFCGCDDTRPSKWDVTDTKRWEIRASGKIVSIDKVSHPSCDNDKGYCSMHAAEILGYCHEDDMIRGWWFNFYKRLVNDAHLNIETKEQMTKRLGDNENDWREAEEVTAL